MDLRSELWAWAKGLPDWQSDLLRRLCSATTLVESDLEEVCHILMVACGGLVKSDPPSVVRLDEERLPQSAKPSGSVRVLSLRELEHIGALDNNQRLEFTPTGLTIIYGDNGSGKSSYSRVLKGACRAIDKPSQILPNIFSPPPADAPQRAIIDIVDGEEQLAIERLVNTPPIPALSSISVFDSGCARIYSDGECEIAYVPSQLDLLTRLAETQDRLGEMLKAKVATIQCEKPQFPELAEGSKARQFIEGMTARSKLSELQVLAQFSPEEDERLSKLRTDLALVSPEETAKTTAELTVKIAGLRAFKDKLNLMVSTLGDRQVAIFRTAIKEFDQAQTLVELLAQEMAKDMTVPGVGSPVWRALWAAAESFALETNPTKPFPPVDPDSALCPLCHQVLREDAIHRFARFKEFATGAAEKELVKARETLRSHDKALSELPRIYLAEGTPDSVLLSGLDPLEGMVKQYGPHLDDRRFAIAEARRGEKAWEQIPPLCEFAWEAIDNQLSAWETRIKELEALLNSEERDKAKQEFADLEARKFLSKRLPDAVTRLDCIQRIYALEKAISLLATRSITAKKTELTTNSITTCLQERLEKEIRALKLGYLRPRINCRGSKGSSLLSVKLEAPTAVKISTVLSEGEQRALSLAFFLAEVGSAEHDGGIILDDPISSMDHDRRGYVAKRLVEEAAKRQVIVFTHDIVFLLELHRWAKDLGVSCKEQVVRRIPGAIGIADASLPWRAKNCKGKAAQLRDELVRLKKYEKEGDVEYEQRAKGWLGRLREAWERAVEEKLFADVVQRFRHSIETQRFNQITITPELIAEIVEGMTVCSSWVHDQAAALQVPLPTASELETLLEKYSAFLSNFASASKAR